ncbi:MULTISPECIES: hypothetical protein [Pedobacter]|uniref:hypothetical protein n=1 Tax=Pedobacter TaxID=84567 RepID=UPI001E2B490C|nr:MULTISPECIES: hypothetical protein [Pedobacter]
MKTLFTFLLSFICLFAVAQKSDSTRTYYRIIRGGMIEHATELKSKRYVKNGESEIKRGRDILARGLYKDGNRYGRWRFFKGPDSVEQIYNYTTKQLEYNHPGKNILYEIDSLTENDKVIYPAKIGGFYTSLRFLIKEFTPSKEFRAYAGVHTVSLIFHIDQTGKLTKYETETGENELKRNEEIPLKELRPEDFDFIPAYVNDKPVSSKLIFRSRLTVN